MQHPVLLDAKSYFGAEFLERIERGETPPKARAISLGQTKKGHGWGMVWYKARADHLRGLVCLVDGVFWLGWEGDRSTNYVPFNSRRAADQHTRHFEPTAQDHARLRLEDAWQAEVERERSTSRWLTGTVLDAWTTRSEQTAVDVGLSATLAVTVEEVEGIVDVELRFEFSVATDVGAVYTAAADALPGVSPEEWDPTFRSDGSGFTLYTMVEARFLDRLVAVREAHGLDALMADNALAADESDGRCHLVRGKDHGRGYAEGALIKSVCGHRFVPSQKPDDLPVCGVCAAVVHALGEATAGRSD